MKKPETGEIFRYVVVPLLFLTVALFGGLRFAEGTGEARFIAPQLVSLILAAFVMVLFVRGGLIEPPEYVGERLGLLDNAAGAARLLSIYFATAQVFNSVTPESGLLNFCFNLFYFLIFWNNLFVVFNPARLTKSLAAVLGTSFLLKYLVLADLFAPSESWAKYVLQKLTETASLGTLAVEAFAPATGYVAFATLALYLLGLYLIAPRVDKSEELLYSIFIERYRLTPRERRRLLSALAETAADEVIEAEIVQQSGVSGQETGGSAAPEDFDLLESDPIKRA
ncbi:MAG TPA: hypothetical protein VE262_21110 [Blastocatellia bacterium]|nr:hypothetical protein [Blastocatellia bacterium]